MRKTREISSLTQLALPYWPYSNGKSVGRLIGGTFHVVVVFFLKASGCNRKDRNKLANKSNMRVIIVSDFKRETTTITKFPASDQLKPLAFGAKYWRRNQISSLNFSLFSPSCISSLKFDTYDDLIKR